jgi:hypothetical protein
LWNSHPPHRCNSSFHSASSKFNLISSVLVLLLSLLLKGAQDLSLSIFLFSLACLALSHFKRDVSADKLFMLLHLIVMSVSFIPISVIAHFSY